jgi:hypothetical protein
VISKKQIHHAHPVLQLQNFKIHILQQFKKKDVISFPAEGRIPDAIKLGFLSLDEDMMKGIYISIIYISVSLCRIGLTHARKACRKFLSYMSLDVILNIYIILHHK